MMDLKQVITFMILVVIGCIQMFGDVIGSASIKGLGLALHVSPAPKVFTAHQGFETFSSRFYLHWTDLDGHSQTTELTAKNFSGLHGPYNRRNAYGAVLSYGPILNANPTTQRMFKQVSQFAFCGQSNLQQELNLNNRDFNQPVIVTLKPRDDLSNSEQWLLSYQVDCLSGFEEVDGLSGFEVSRSNHVSRSNQFIAEKNE